MNYKLISLKNEYNISEGVDHYLAVYMELRDDNINTYVHCVIPYGEPVMTLTTLNYIENYYR